MIATLADYGAGNLHSLAKALDLCGATPRIVDDPHAALDSELLVLPGVGAFAPAAAWLAPARDALRRRLAGGLPCIGVCLGMQLLFDDSEEGAGAGLGAIAGHVVRMRARRLPQMGWNEVVWVAPAPLGVAYFANSFACEPDDRAAVTAVSEYDGTPYAAAVRQGRIAGFQFHPEKSGDEGLALLRATLAEVCA